MDLRAVIFDIGGVIVDSPLHVIAAYERELGIEPGLVNRVVVAEGPGGAWPRLERGELSLEEFYAAFDAECAAAGARLSAREMMERIARAVAPRPAMIEAVRRIRSRGLRTGALTNNWPSEEGSAAAPLRELFDAFVESSVEGLRKPDPRIYELACERIGAPPAACVFLDDIGRNLKPARALGMTTIKVEQPERALAELERVLGFELE